MTPELKRVIWEWLPGNVAGFMPLLVFLLVNYQLDPALDPHLDKVRAARAVADASGRFWDGLVEHFVVFSIVASTVSTFTSFPRLFAKGKEDAPVGLASLSLVMMMVMILVFSVAMYVLHEARVTDSHTLGPSLTLLVATLVISFYIEVTIANLRLTKKKAAEGAAAPQAT